MTSFTLVSLDDLREPNNDTMVYFVPIVLAFGFHLAVQYREPLAHHFIIGQLLMGCGMIAIICEKWDATLSEGILITAKMNGVFVASILTSMVLYRIFFHPLRNIPGPIACKISMWTWPLTDWIGNRHHKIQQLHKKYGDLVRIGPREVSSADPSNLIHFYGPAGPSSKALRGPWYTAQSMIPHVHSLQNEPTIPMHNRRRRDWDPAFSMKALEGYKINIQRNADKLLDQIETIGKKGTVDLRECMMWFGFDVMGELGFGRSFGTLDSGKTSHEVHLAELGVRAINTMGNVPYIAHIMRFLPSPIQSFETWLEKALIWRQERQGQRDFVDADIFSYLLGEEGKQHRKLSKQELQQDCMLVVVAGSDTTSNAMSFCLFELARQPQLVERLRQEMLTLFPDDAKPDNFDTLRDHAPLLNACIHESLRMWPPVPSGLQRTLTSDLILPNGQILPSNTVVSTHTWTMHRDPRNFYKPDRFIPDRWLKENSGREVHNAKAWSPFGYGTTSCIGKNLAYMEMRLVLAQFIMRFDFFMEPAHIQEFRSSIRDQFVASAGEMITSVVPRREAK